jgi:hypothetical protein
MLYIAHGSWFSRLMPGTIPAITVESVDDIRQRFGLADVLSE